MLPLMRLFLRPTDYSIITRLTGPRSCALLETIILKRPKILSSSLPPTFYYTHAIYRDGTCLSFYRQVFTHARETERTPGSTDSNCTAQRKNEWFTRAPGTQTFLIKCILIAFNLIETRTKRLELNRSRSQVQ